MIERKNTSEERIDSLLPPPELLERYNELGLGTNLVELVKAEQEHRHKLQRKYAMSYRIGQLGSLAIILYYLTGIFRLVEKGFVKEAYSITAIMSLLVLVVVIILRRKRDIVAKKRAGRTNTNNNSGRNNNQNGRTFRNNYNRR
jgi:uncharacterized membrane protein